MYEIYISSFGGVLNGVRRGGLKTLDDVYDIIDEQGSITRQKANEIINSITICDPAVGSGHFLVSALNEILAIKNDLRILQDRDGRRLKEYNVSVVNDELIITDENNSLFEYNYQNKESQRVQEAIFHEKQTIIENCLFGVDINPNSVKICRLRLWIELLKHAYYKSENELETLPNIDINIKCGNSLISRFEIDADLKQALKSSKWNIQSYRNAVATYRNAKNKEEKREMERLINDIKNDFRTEINKNSKEMIKLFKLEKEQYEKFVAPQLFGHTLTPAQKKKLEEEHKTINTKIETLKAEIEEIKNNKIYINAFEWRFEFPEVLSEEGDFVGFDVVVGNPPYFALSNDKSLKQVSDKYETFSAGDIYALFIELSQRILIQNGFSTLIISNKWLRANYGEPLRNYIVNNTNPLNLVDFGQNLLFENATVHTNILTLNKNVNRNQLSAIHLPDNFFADDNIEMKEYIDQNFIYPLEVDNNIWNIIDKALLKLNDKALNLGKKIKDWDLEFYRGILTGLNEAFIIDETIKTELIEKDPRSEELIKPILRGRDTRRYYCNYANQYIINSHNGYSDIPRLDVINDYPSIYEHLIKYEEKAAARYDKGKHWTNLRNCAYLDKFETPKIIFSEIVSEPQFYYDELGYYPEASVFFISGENLKYLTALLNSKMITFLFKTFYMGGELVGKIRYKKAFLEQVPIVEPSPTQETQITDLVNQILAAKKQDPEADTQELEDEIDYFVYKLYDLTYDEVLIVDPDTKLTREEY